MTRSLLTGTVLAAALAAPASAQTLGASWTRTFFGCDEMRSCHRIMFSFAPDPLYPWNQVGSIQAWSWFFTPGSLHRFFVSPFNYYMTEIYGLYEHSGTTTRLTRTTGRPKGLSGGRRAYPRTLRTGPLEAPSVTTTRSGRL
jgi:hypothetical protein